MPITMQNNTIVNIVIGASSLKIIHCEKKDTDVIIKNSVILETGSSLYLTSDKLNIGFIEDKLRVFFYENKIKNGKICFILPDYMIGTKAVKKQQVLTKDYISNVIKTKQLHELLDEEIHNEESLIFDCHVFEQTDGTSDVMVSQVNNSVVKSLKKMSRRLKMTPAILEPEINGFLRLIDMFGIKDNYMLIDIGEIYTKIILVNGTTSLSCEVHSSGVYTIDNLISRLYNCLPMIASEKRIEDGIITESSKANKILSDVIRDAFAVHIIEHLNTIQTAYGGLHYIHKFLISGGAWNIQGFKETLENHTLKLFNTNASFEDYSSFINNITFDNDIVKSDIIDNINSYASCVGLSLRGGL